MLVDIASKITLPSQNGPATPPTPPHAVAVSGGTAPVDHPNPQYQLNAALGIVVIQFRNASGRVELSIPNQAKLDAYANKGFDRSPSSEPPIEA